MKLGLERLAAKAYHPHGNVAHSCRTQKECRGFIHPLMRKETLEAMLGAPGDVVCLPVIVIVCH